MSLTNLYTFDEFSILWWFTLMFTLFAFDDFTLALPQILVGHRQIYLKHKNVPSWVLCFINTTLDIIIYKNVWSMNEQMQKRDREKQNNVVGSMCDWHFIVFSDVYFLRSICTWYYLLISFRPCTKTQVNENRFSSMCRWCLTLSRTVDSVGSFFRLYFLFLSLSKVL